jgi:Zn-dependent metalloprotease
MEVTMKSYYVIIQAIILPTILAVGIYAQNLQEYKTSDRFGNPITIKKDARSKAVMRISGLNRSTRDYGFQSGELNKQAVVQVATAIFSDYVDITKITANSLRFRQVVNVGGKWYILAEQIFNGIPVWGTEYGFTIEENGNIHTLGGIIYPSVVVGSINPKITVSEAFANCKIEFEKGYGGKTTETMKEPQLVIYPHFTGYVGDFILAYLVEISGTLPPRRVAYFVNAVSGEVIAQHNLIMEGGKFYVYVNHQYWPQHHYDTPITESSWSNVTVKLYDIQHEVSSGLTNANGYWESPYVYGGNYYLKFIKNTNDLTSDYATIWNGVIINENTNWMSPPSTVTHNFVNQETNAFYHAKIMHDYFASDPFNYTGMNYEMLVKMNQGSGVNGGSDGTDIYFGSKYGYLWAGAADVIYHEYTHSTIYHLYGRWIRNVEDDSAYYREGAAMDEGLSDYFAGVKTNDPVHGESCEGSRTLSNSYTMDNFNDLYDWGVRGAHANGQIIGGACWDLRQALSTTDQLVFGALKRTPHAYDFSDFADNIVYEDDNDGNPDNGTPNLETIRLKFYGKKIYFSAGPPRTPQTLALAGTTGDNEPILSWTANIDKDFSSYQVWRNINTQGGPPGNFSLLSTVTTNSYTDYGLAYGGSWKVYYKIKAVDVGGLTSAYSNMLTITSSGFFRRGEQDDNSVLVDGQSIPKDYALLQNYPNPFNSETDISFALTEPSRVRVTVSDILGREISTLIEGVFPAGLHRVSWAGMDRKGQKIGSGIYLCRITAIAESGHQFTRVVKMLLSK